MAEIEIPSEVTAAIGTILGGAAMHLFREWHRRGASPPPELLDQANQNVALAQAEISSYITEQLRQCRQDQAQEREERERERDELNAKIAALSSTILNLNAKIEELRGIIWRGGLA